MTSGRITLGRSFHARFGRAAGFEPTTPSPQFARGVHHRSAAVGSSIGRRRRSSGIHVRRCYVVVRTLVRLLVSAGPPGRAEGPKDLEILVLGHQLRVLQRTSGRPKLRAIDRVLLAAASRVIPRDRWVAFLVALRSFSGGSASSCGWTVDVPKAGPDRAATDRHRDPRAHPPARPGEPPLGLRPDRAGSSASG